MLGFFTFLLFIGEQNSPIICFKNDMIRGLSFCWPLMGEEDMIVLNIFNDQLVLRALGTSTKSLLLITNTNMHVHYLLLIPTLLFRSSSRHSQADIDNVFIQIK
jgi:hypothetical protein